MISKTLLDNGDCGDFPTGHLRPAAKRKGGAHMRARVKTLLLALAIVAFAAANGGNPWGP
jgi:hypothetical protein